MSSSEKGAIKEGIAAKNSATSWTLPLKLLSDTAASEASVEIFNKFSGIVPLTN